MQPCFLCGDACGSEHFCFGCGKYICDRCDEMEPVGSHEPKEHQYAESEEARPA